ncbi:hydrocephalus-inducing protein-like [Agelaius tricolor]|uniref:hydrocephalus-inducing protein-like n=1 Tax=Agelaius tricolor TaxID=9191 RepID=UPI0039F22474
MSETRPKLSPAPPKRSVFGVSPRELVFQNVVAHEVSEMVLSIMNKDKIAQMVKVCMESSPYFQLACPSDVYHIVPPGASAPVRIRFSPDENKDYSHELTCIMAKEKIVVPIRAIGARAILDFPAQVDFSECPVKHSTQKTLLVRNVGNRTAHYQLSTQSPFSVVPTAGTLGAGDTMQVTVTFHALTNGEHFGSLCCNTGREIRLPLCLRGKGQGPLVELSSPTLNLGNVFVYTPYVYEVELINKGALDAPFTYIPSTTNVDFCFTVEPEQGMIAPGGTQTVQISFHTTVLGSFEEKFQFSVAGSPTPVILTIRGSVTAPNLHFDLPELDFGDISFGFPYTQRCRLTNCSMVPVTFKLRMSDDGTQPAVDSLDQICKEGDPSWRKGIHFYVEPREFTMNPSQGTILPQGHQDIEVTLCSNTVMEFYRRLLVDLEGFGEGVASVVITARDGVVLVVTTLHWLGLFNAHLTVTNVFCSISQSLGVNVLHSLSISDSLGVISLPRCLVPELHVYPQILLYHECHLKVPYERKLVIRNLSNLPGCYGLIPQQRKDDSPVLYSSPKPCGIVQPYGTAEIPVIIEVQTLGEHRTKALVGVFGDERNPRGVELRSSGRLAEIYPSPSVLEFGSIPALQPASQSFTLFNKGLVPVDFSMEMASKSNCFVIEPSEGAIPARGEVPVTVTATLDDTVGFDDTVQLFIGNSLWSSVFLQAFGIGTTIVTDKPFAPELNLGYQFSLVPCIHQFKVTNKGRRYHQLFWSAECYSPPEEGGQSVSTLSSPRAKDDSQRPKRASPVFGLEPLSMDLQPGQSEDMVLRGFSRMPQHQLLSLLATIRAAETLL